MKTKNDPAPPLPPFLFSLGVSKSECGKCPLEVEVLYVTLYEFSDLNISVILRNSLFIRAFTTLLPLNSHVG